MRPGIEIVSITHTGCQMKNPLWAIGGETRGVDNYERYELIDREPDFGLDDTDITPAKTSHPPDQLRIVANAK